MQLGFATRLFLSLSKRTRSNLFQHPQLQTKNGKCDTLNESLQRVNVLTVCVSESESQNCSR